MFWFIAVSGFAYNVGSDIPEYMYFYDSMGIENFHGWKNLFTSDRYQPGWYVLNILCHYISDDFVVLKFVMSLFLNGVVFWFIQKHCDKIFLAVFFYSILLYFDLNFNALRQSLSIGFFLIGYDLLCEKKWVQYLLFLGFAYLFHSSALAFVPLVVLPFIKANRITITLAVLLLLFLLYIVLTIDVADLIFTFAAMDMDVSEEWTRSSMVYMTNLDETGINANGVFHKLFEIILYSLIALFSLKKNKGHGRSLDSMMLMIYLALSILALSAPIAFFRFLQYIKLFYACILADTLVYICNKLSSKSVKVLGCFMLVFVFSFLPIRSYFSGNPSSGIPLIRQYVPYYSVFNKKIDKVRASNFGSHQ